MAGQLIERVDHDRDAPSTRPVGEDDGEDDGAVWAGPERCPSLGWEPVTLGLEYVARLPQPQSTGGGPEAFGITPTELPGAGKSVGCARPLA